MSRRRLPGPGDTVVLDRTQVHVTARCPFCAGKYTAFFTKGESVGTVMHTMPACPTFLKLEVVAFLKAARAAGAVVLSGGPDLS